MARTRTTRTNTRPRRGSPLRVPDAFELFGRSKNLVLKHIWVFGPLYAVPLIFYIHDWLWSPLPHQKVAWWHSASDFSSGWPGSPFPFYETFLVVGFSFVWLIVITVAGTIAHIMAQQAQLWATENRSLQFDKLWLTVKQKGWRLVGLYIVMSLAILIGLCLLIIPGLILLRRFFLAPYVMLAEDTDIRQSLDRSTALSKINTGAIWGVIGVMFLIGLVNIIPIIGGLASFVLGCLYSVAPAMRYHQLKKLS